MEMRVGNVVIQARCLLEFADGFIQISGFAEDHAKVVV